MSTIRHCVQSRFDNISKCELDNEKLGPSVVKLFDKTRIDNVDPEIADQKAIDADTLFINQNLNRTFLGKKDWYLFEENEVLIWLKLFHPI